MQDIKAGKIDEDGLGINNVESALARVNIKLRDSDTSFRDFSTVLEELSKKWGTLNEVEQANVSKAIAGVRQANIFNVLMNNMNQALELQAEQFKATGLAAERYQIYLESVEAAQNRMTASWENLIQSAEMTDMIVGFYDGASAVLDLVDALGGLATILKVVIPLIIFFNAATIQTSIMRVVPVITGLASALNVVRISYFGAATAAEVLALQNASVATSAIAANLAALPFVLTLTALVAVAYLYGKALKKVREEQEKIRTDLLDKTTNIAGSATSYEDYLSKAKEAAKASGYVYDESGKMFKKGYHDMLVYVNGMDLLTEAQWKARDSAVALDKGEKDDIAALKKLSAVAKEAAKSFEELKNEAFTTLLADESFNKIIDDTITLLKQQANIKKESLQLELKNLKDSNDKYKETYKLQIDSIKNISVEKKKAIEDEINAQNQLYDSQKNAIEEQLKAYKAIIDEQKISLQLKKEETDFNNARAEKEKVLSDLINQIAILRLDTSQSATAQRMTLEEEASKLTQELSQSDADRAYQLQIESLDAEQQNAEDTANIQLSALEETKKNYEIEAGLRQNALDDEQTKAEQRYEIITKGLDDTYNAKEIALQNQIAQVDDYLSKEGLLRKEAIDRIISDNGTLYAQLAEWNRVYGTGIETDIRSKWDSAIVSLNTYKDILESISRIGIPQGAFPSGDPSQNSEYVDVYNGRNNPNVLYAGRHSGVKSGFVGNQPKLKSNEEFAKLLDGELVVNSKQMDTFMKNLSPATMNSNPSSSSSNFAGGVSMGNLMNIVVTGSLDKTILPSIKNIADQVLDELNKAVLIRGSNRTANLFGN